MAHSLKGRRQLLRLWNEPDGLCTVCHLAHHETDWLA